MRRHYLTHPSFQIRFTLFFGLGALIVVGLLGAATVGALLLLANDPQVSVEQRQVMAHGIERLWALIGLTGLISTLVFLFVGFYSSYKNVGPLYRLETWLETQISQPDNKPIQLRPGDELEKIAELLHQRIQTFLGSSQ